MSTFQHDSPQLATSYDAISDPQYLQGLSLLEELGVEQRCSVLDLGCGTGRLTAECARIIAPEGRVLGLDPLPDRIAVAKRYESDRLTFVVGDASHLASLPAGFFDAVYLNSVLHWISDQLQTLRHVARVLRPGGVLGLTTASAEDPNTFRRGLVAVMNDLALTLPASSVGSTRKVTPAGLTAMYEEVGLVSTSTSVRAVTDTFADLEHVLKFRAASSFGNFLHGVPNNERHQIFAGLRQAFAPFTDSKGTHMTRHVIFSLAEKTGGPRE
jgi:arsenite methyltransferase